MEEALHVAEQPAHPGAQKQGTHNFKEGIDQNGDHADMSAVQGFGYPGGNREDDEAHGVVQGHDGKQDRGQGTLGLVLVDDHDGGGRSGGGGNGTQDQAGGNGKHLAAHHQVQQEQAQIHKHRGGEGLENGNDGSLAANVLQLGQPELVADGEGDEAQSHVADQPHFLHELKGAEAQAGNPKSAQHQRPHQKPRDQIAGDVGQIKAFGQTGKQQSRQHGKTNGKEIFHKKGPRFLSNFATIISF